MRLAAVAQEAWRNTATGASRPIITAALFVILLGSLSFLQADQLTRLNRDAAVWRESGASTQIVSAPQAIDGPRCEALSSLDGITASGAVRNGSEITLAAMPSAPLMTIEATPGLAQLIGVQGPVVGGVWVSSDLEAVVGRLSYGETVLQTRDGLAIPVAGSYLYTEDGRLPLLAHTFVSPVAPEGTFDSCWLEVWPESVEVDQLIVYPVAPERQMPGENPKIQQLNTSLGSSFDAQGRLNQIPTWLYSASAIGIGAVIGWSLARVRRLQIASELHAGVDKASMTLQILMELFLVLLPAATLALVGAAIAATVGNPDPVWSAFIPAAYTIGVGVFATLLGGAFAAATVQERHLFRYFKGR